ncbi:photosystem I reaction center subunit VI, chloroplastic [Physcomitrium patens]|uniref:Photosystem I reaction center subunit VI, chloroplastic n=2 Tax=Physcomitrium patens TaxID=3218 RepID=A0A2K1JDR4_PHYPA|nr:photosystem I reaction center subunit VI-2, chloroplastic-like [Physcomitrium patens]PNR39665.1 hypothetical protein PHYPA_019944 [Physcomitrium patens]8HTU_H Chain H, Photosystem I reaction center subunit VI, chloroplastic [Physcomitrium patens]|eukprot:XP_024396298.1 photosystem I reaction center subunit VI-2, chloroplastic-like [Physcomitrella patens]
MAAASATMAVSGLAGSSLAGQKFAIAPAKSVSVRSPSKVGAISAKYGEKSVYFDLGEIDNTTGNWDLYGNDDPNRYNGFQNKFFETFAGAFTKRGLLLKFLVLGGATTIGYLGSTSSGDLLAIKNGPKQAPIMGPRGRK